MHKSLEKTFGLLATTANDSAVEALIAALDAPHRGIEEGALRAILKRRGVLGPRELIGRWHTMCNRWKAIIADRSGRFAAAVRDAMQSHDAQSCQNGCDAILRLREYDLIPTLVSGIDSCRHPQSELLARTLITITEHLYDELASQRDYRNRRDPQLVRQFVLTTLEPSVSRYAEHKRLEVVESFLTLANRDNATLKKILFNPYDSAHAVVLELLSSSPRPGIMRLLLNYLDDPTPPGAVMNILANRRDVPYMRHFLRRIGSESSHQTKLTLRRIENFGWRNDLAELLNTLNENEQTTLAGLLSWSGMARDAVFESLRVLLRRGAVRGRAEAVGLMNEFRQREANDEIVLALSDPAPEVQARALLQLRDRHITGAMDRLLDAIDSPHEIVRRAVQQSLSEFNFIRFMAAFDKLEDDVKRSTGRLVRKLDPTSIEVLRAELDCDSRSRMGRAMEMTQVMGVASELEDDLIAKLDDLDHILRVQAIETLISCRTPRTKRALLRAAQEDTHIVVQETAEEALQWFHDVAADAADDDEKNALARSPQLASPTGGAAQED